MKLIISGTNREGSNSLKISQILQRMYQQQGETVEILDIRTAALEEMAKSPYSLDNRPAGLAAAVAQVNRADGLVLVVPEYNGSIPGILKYFIDHWTYPESFEARPVCFVGIGGRFGGLRPVEHLQQVFGYRNAYVFPERVFISNVWSVLKDGELQDELVVSLLQSQVTNFQKFVIALQSQSLDANSRSKTPQQ